MDRKLLSDTEANFKEPSLFGKIVDHEVKVWHDVATLNATKAETAEAVAIGAGLTLTALCAKPLAGKMLAALKSGSTEGTLTEFERGIPDVEAAAKPNTGIMRLGGEHPGLENSLSVEALPSLRDLHAAEPNTGLNPLRDIKINWGNAEPWRDTSRLENRIPNIGADAKSNTGTMNLGGETPKYSTAARGPGIPDAGAGVKPNSEVVSVDGGLRGSSKIHISFGRPETTWSDDPTKGLTLTAKEAKERLGLMLRD